MPLGVEYTQCLSFKNLLIFFCRHLKVLGSKLIIEMIHNFKHFYKNVIFHIEYVVSLEIPNVLYGIVVQGFKA